MKAFMDIDICGGGCVGSRGCVGGCLGGFIGCREGMGGKKKVLFMEGGFGIEKCELGILGIEWELLEIDDLGGEGVGGKVESLVWRGDIGGVVYCKGNNGGWICVEESELKIIGEVGRK